jgi:hypothetical protein
MHTVTLLPWDPVFDCCSSIICADSQHQIARRGEQGALQPISSIWALQLQENNYWLNKPDRNVVNQQFQPVLPLALTDWNLISCPVFQALDSTPYVNETGHLYHVTRFGDTILATMLSPSPKPAGPWLFAIGPSVVCHKLQ